MTTYTVTEAHKTDVHFKGKRTEVKKFIKTAHKCGTDPMFWDVHELLSNGIISIWRAWGGDFIETGFKN